MVNSEIDKRYYDGYPQLVGHTILIIHAQNFFRTLTDVLYGMQKMYPLCVDEHNFPDDLLSFMQTRNLESMIVHPASDWVVDQIIQTYNHNKRIVVLGKSGDVSRRFTWMNERLTNAHVPVFLPELGPVQQLASAVGYLATLF